MNAAAQAQIQAEVNAAIAQYGADRVDLQFNNNGNLVGYWIRPANPPAAANQPAPAPAANQGAGAQQGGRRRRRRKSAKKSRKTRRGCK